MAYLDNFVISDEMAEDMKGTKDFFTTLMEDAMNPKPISAEEKEKRRIEYEAECVKAREIWEKMQNAVTPEELEIFEMHFEVR